MEIETLFVITLAGCYELPGLVVLTTNNNMHYWALFKGKTPFNKLLLSFDKRAELYLRLTNKW